jgi:hypothetical protein
MAEIACNSENIYQKYILPAIERSRKGDELLFVTPSTFFGFYSLGAKTYEEVCKSLRAAKDRGVQCQIIIDVRDVFTATAAQGLLTFLKEGAELRWLRNPATYYLLCYRKGRASDFIEFDSKGERSLDFLPNVTVRPFAGLLREPPEKLADAPACTRRAIFNILWEKSEKGVKDAVILYVPWFYLRRRFDFVQVASLFGFFGFGTMFGMAIMYSRYEEFRFSVGIMFAYVLFSMIVGFVAHSISAWITRRGFGRK